MASFLFVSSFLTLFKGIEPCFLGSTPSILDLTVRGAFCRIFGDFKSFLYLFLLDELGISGFP